MVVLTRTAVAGRVQLAELIVTSLPGVKNRTDVIGTQVPAV